MNPSPLRIALIGFGGVNKALAGLLLRKMAYLESLGSTPRLTAVLTGSRGAAIDENGLDIGALLAADRLSDLPGGQPSADPLSFIQAAPADVVFEASPTNPVDGQPALGALHAALGRGLHVITANKGPIAHGYRQLSALAKEKGAGLFFESTVMSGAPVLSTVREGLAGSQIVSVRGILNGTTNYILSRMEDEGIDFQTALKAAQEIGVAETDPTLDIEGWDAAIKTAILANVLLGADIRPADVQRQGITQVSAQQLQAARDQGQRTRLICEVRRSEGGALHASVQPTAVPLSDPLANVLGTGNMIAFETDLPQRIVVWQAQGGPLVTAYGMFADLVAVLRGRHL